jgi:hypothetical protein
MIERKRMRNINLDKDFVEWMRMQRKNFEKQTGVNIPSDYKFSAVLMRGGLLRIKVPKGRMFNARF